MVFCVFKKIGYLTFMIALLYRTKNPFDCDGSLLFIQNRYGSCDK